MDQAAKIFLDRTLQRVDNGEFDEHLSIPFASRKLMKLNIEDQMKKKLETNTTPVFSDAELYEIVGDVRESAAQTVAAFIKIGIMEETATGYGLSEKWTKVISATKLIS